MKAKGSSFADHEVFAAPFTQPAIDGLAGHVRRFITARFLEQIPRSLLESFFDRFGVELAQAGLTLRSNGRADSDYYFNARFMLLRPAGLPPAMCEGLRLIRELANPQDQDRLHSQVERAGIKLSLGQCTPAELAMRVWMIAPQLLAKASSEARLARLALFDYFGARNRVARSCDMEIPAPVIARIQDDLDAWFAAHHRGEDTVRLENHRIDSEHWFLVRHGDTFARKAAVERQTTEILEYRPAKDDVIVYSPDRDELRINARTEGEKNLYRQAFGLRLFGDAEYFSDLNAYTLDPLREEGPRALDVHDVPGIHRILLAEIELKFGENATIHRFDNAFGCGSWPNIPSHGDLARAVFDVFFAGHRLPRKVELLAPNRLRQCRHCDVHLIQRWLSKRGFRESSRASRRLVV